MSHWNPPPILGALSGIALLLAMQPILLGEEFTLQSQAPTAESQQRETVENSEKPSLFFDPEDGAFDMSGFLSTRTGFLPLAIPITEPAVGLGLGIGLTFFHDRPIRVPGHDGAPSRLIMPSTTVVFGLATENGTWGTGLGHLGVWNQGRIRYLGAGGFAQLNLNWFGKGDALQGRSISYTNDMLFLVQRLTFQLGDSNFFVGPQYLYAGTDSSFQRSGLDSGIPSFELQSNISGAGVDLSYDSLDQPFSPTKGIRSEISYAQFAEWLGGDFDFGRLHTYGIMYIPFGEKVVLGVRADGQFNVGDGPFYALPFLSMRGIAMGRYVDNNAVLTEAELRWDFARRWSLVGFGGVGRVADSVGDLLDADNHFAYGTGFRYLIAQEYGLRLGVDVAHADDDWNFYITVGTGWVRP